MNILLTGCAGFIGFHMTQRLSQLGHHIIGVDNLNNYYDVSLKQNRLQILQAADNFQFLQFDIADRQKMQALFADNQFDIILHLAAQAGVRYSLDNPAAYVDANLVGFANILEGARQQKIAHLIYASSSSVYGANTKYPFSESDAIDHPVSLYAASKKSNEMMAHSYAHLYHIPCTGLRFFTVYGPYGRPDMAYYKFSEKILSGEPIEIYNQGNMWRDFTYIDDIVEGIVRMIEQPAKANPNWQSDQPDPASSYAPYQIYNIGYGSPVNLLDFITTLEKHLGKTAEKKYRPMQPGDVYKTYADTRKLNRDFGYQPKVDIEQGIEKFVEWYLSQTCTV